MHQIATDAELIAASIDDATLFTRIFDRHFVEIHTFVQRRLGARLADRVTTRTFVDAFHTRDEYRDRGADARPWLYGIAVRHIARHHRRERRLLLAYARRGPSILREPQLAAAQRTAPDRASRVLAREIARLSNEQRDALLMASWSKLNPAQIAEATGCSARDISQRVQTARRALTLDGLAAFQPVATRNKVARV